MIENENLTTESHHPASAELDRMNAEQLIALMVEEDSKCVQAVESQRQVIAKAVKKIAGVLAKDGRLFYLGAGTSGRLGVLDASECPPTFNSPPSQVIGLIAGGDSALRTSIEGAEDEPSQAVADLENRQFNENDILVGIATSGRTPYVIAGLEYAHRLGAETIGLCCNRENLMEPWVDILICPVVGPELISGSTRMKSGTATKMILNMLTTGAMVLNGKTYGNLMVDLRASNRKLAERSIRILQQLTDLDREKAQAQLEAAGRDLKRAVVGHHVGNNFELAGELLSRSGGNLRAALKLAEGSVK